MSTIYKYRARCIEEDIYVTQYGAVPPTLCPNNHANRELDLSTLNIVETIAPKTLVAKEDSEGYYQSKSVIMQVPAGVTGAISTASISWPIDILLWQTEFYVGEGSDGDIFNAVAAPNTTIGICTSNVAIGDTVIHVSPTVFDYISYGLNLNISDGVNNNALGVIVEINYDDGTITIETPTTNSFLVGSFIILNLFVVKDYYVFGSNPSGLRTTFGTKGFKGKPISANMPLQLIYTNNTGTAKVVAFKTEYYITEWYKPI